MELVAWNEDGDDIVAAWPFYKVEEKGERLFKLFRRQGKDDCDLLGH